MKKEAIVILGGALIKKREDGWRTSNFKEKGKARGALGDRLRVVAGSLLYKKNPNSLIIASGGRGRSKDVSEIPTLAEVIKSELIELGVPEEDIVMGANSGNTFQQLQELKRIISKQSPRSISIVSNEYHLPRIQIMIEDDAILRKLFKHSEIKLCSAERILVGHEPGVWKAIVDTAYQSKEMKKIIAQEKRGVRQLKKNLYILQ